MSLELETSIYLGGDTDCETCGSSYNHLNYEFEPLTGVHRLQLSVGCYGGDNLETTDTSEARTFVDDIGERFPTAPTELHELAECITVLGARAAA